MPVLYRKYRPQKFSDVVGQQHVIQTLKNALTGGSVSHAYLFTGTRGVGKTTIARILARAVNCTNLKKGEVCMECDNCLAISKNGFMDLVEIDAASNTGVDNVRELIEHVRFTPSQGKYKVFIIDEVHMLSRGAFNALLKTLEEPPAHAIFVLATTEIHKVPATIISRTQRFDFRALTIDQTVQQLESIIKQESLKIPSEVLELVARQSEGSLRDALSLLDKISTLGTAISVKSAEQLLGVTSFAVIFQLFEFIFRRQPASISPVFDEMMANGTDFSILNRDILEFLRKLLVIKLGATLSGEISEEQRLQFATHSELVSVPDLLHIIRLFLRSYKEIGSSPSPELPLLLAAIEASMKVAPGAVASPVSQGQQTRQVTPAQTQIPAPPQVSSVPHSPKIVQAASASKDNASGMLDKVDQIEVERSWPHIIEAVKKVNSPLATLLRNSPIMEVTNSIIIIGVKYLFHKEHLESTKNYSLVTNTIFGVMGKRVGVSAKISKIIAENDPTTAAEVLTDALRVFGGELIE